jgi:hypothetical protein
VRTALQEPDDQAAAAFLRHSLHSRRLIQELDRRQTEFDAFIVGPYLQGLTADVTRTFPERTLLLPCFHDEPLARLPIWPLLYGAVAGILYHSLEEKDFAEIELGCNVPGGDIIGTYLEPGAGGDGEHGCQRVGRRRYLLYCGRLLEEKGVALLLQYAQRYASFYPDRFSFVFLGEGAVKIPRQPWCRNLGFVDEPTKRDVMAGAAALVQLSQQESLSLVALEAWQQGIPVVAHQLSPALAGHLERCSGGRLVEDYASFAATLDDLYHHSGAWQTRGQQGKEYVQQQFGSQTAFGQKLIDAIREIRMPLAERMRRRGHRRAEAWMRPRWREQFAGLVESVCRRARPHRQNCIEVQPRTPSRSVSVGSGQFLLPVRVINHGTYPLAAEGPGRFLIQASVWNDLPDPHRGPPVPLPGIALPGYSMAAVVPVPVPGQPGSYRITFSFVSPCSSSSKDKPSLPTEGEMNLDVEERGSVSTNQRFMLLQDLQTALVEAHRLARLPDHYLDITTGWFAFWKQWLKRKLLGNFKHAYVDVLSRQQSQFNERVLTALNELTEYLAVNDSVSSKELVAKLEETERRLQQTRRRLNMLRKRLARLQKDDDGSRHSKMPSP